jgi:hypothetical protein
VRRSLIAVGAAVVRVSEVQSLDFRPVSQILDAPDSGYAAMRMVPNRSARSSGSMSVTGRSLTDRHCGWKCATIRTLSGVQTLTVFTLDKGPRGFKHA